MIMSQMTRSSGTSWCDISTIPSTQPCRILLTTGLFHKDRVLDSTKTASVLRAYQKMLQDHKDVRMRIYYDSSIRDAEAAYKPLMEELGNNKAFELVKFKCTLKHVWNDDATETKGFVGHVVRLHALCEGQRSGAACVCPVDVVVSVKNANTNDPYYDAHSSGTIRTKEWLDTIREFIKNGKDDLLYFNNVSALESCTFDDGSSEGFSNLMRPCMVAVRKPLPLSVWKGLLSVHNYKNVVTILRRYDAYRAVQMGPKAFIEGLYEDFGKGCDAIFMAAMGGSRLSSKTLLVNYSNGIDRVVDRIVGAIRWSGDRSYVVQALCKRLSVNNVHSLLKTIEKDKRDDGISLVRKFQDWDNIQDLFLDRNVLRALRTLDGDHGVKPFEQYIILYNATKDSIKRANVSWLAPSRPRTKSKSKSASISAKPFEHKDSIKLSRYEPMRRSNPTDKGPDRAWFST